MQKEVDIDTQALSVFVTAVSTGSIAAAGRRHGLAPVVASRRLSALESEVGARLLQRSTRSLSLTDEGQAFLPHAREILDRETEALNALRPGHSGASGLLRLTAPAALGREVIVPLLPDLFAAHPQLRVELRLTERLVDLVAEGLDLAIRIADLRDTEMVARRIGTVRRVVCASPAYLAQHGNPATRSDLSRHECLTLVGSPHWLFEGPSGVEKVRVSGRMTCDAIDGLHAACRVGAGIAMLSTWSVANDLETGQLIELPLDASPHAPPIAALYPSARMLSPRVRVFMSAITKAPERTRCPSES